MEHLTEQQLRSLLRAPESKRLIELLQASGTEALNKAAEAARSGDFAAVKQILSPTLQGSGAEKLAEQLKYKLG